MADLEIKSGYLRVRVDGRSNQFSQYIPHLRLERIHYVVLVNSAKMDIANYLKLEEIMLNILV